MKTVKLYSDSRQNQTTSSPSAMEGALMAIGWMVAHRESAALAKRLIVDTCEKQQITREQLTLHADQGSSMKSKLVAHLLSDLRVTKSPFQAACQQRQPVLGSPVQNPEIFTCVPRTVRLHTGCAGILPAVFRLVQLRPQA